MIDFRNKKPLEEAYMMHTQMLSPENSSTPFYPLCLHVLLQGIKGQEERRRYVPFAPDK